MVRFSVYILFFLIIIFYSCIPIVHNKSKLIRKENLPITALKTEGYYFTVDQSRDKEDKFIVARLLFENGIFREIGRISLNDTSAYKKRCPLTLINTYEVSQRMLECMLDNYEYFFKIKTNFLNRNSKIWNWGRFEITNGEIKVQYFYNYLGNYYLLEEKGEIINTDSFRIKSIFDNKTKKSTEVNVLYLFKEYNVDEILKYSPDM